MVQTLSGTRFASGSVMVVLLYDLGHRSVCSNIYFAISHKFQAIYPQCYPQVYTKICSYLAGCISQYTLKIIAAYCGIHNICYGV